MPSTFTTRNRLEKQAAGENSNTWGDRLNSNTIDLADFAMDGFTSFTLSTTKTLSTTNGGADEARARVINVTGGTGGTITIPNLEKMYIVRNASSGDVVITTGSGTTTTVASENIAVVICNGSNVVLRLGVDRQIPRLTSVDTNLTPADNGRTVRSSSGATRTFTVAPESDGSWPSAATVTAVPSSTGSIVIAGGTGVTITWAGQTGSRTLAAGGRAVLERITTNSWLLSGAGIS